MVSPAWAPATSNNRSMDGIRPAVIDRTLLFARPPVLSAARVKDNCSWLSSIAAPSCQTWLRAATGNYCRVSGGFAPLTGSAQTLVWRRDSPPCVSGMRQVEKKVSRRRRDGDEVRAVAGADGIAARGPARRCRQIGVLLQAVTARVQPGNNDAVAGMHDGQVGKSGRPHHGDEAPKTAGERIAVAAHQIGRIRLPNSAADGIQI